MARPRLVPALAWSLVLGLVACGSSVEGGGAPGAQSDTSAATPEPQAPGADAPPGEEEEEETEDDAVRKPKPKKDAGTTDAGADVTSNDGGDAGVGLDGGAGNGDAAATDAGKPGPSNAATGKCTYREVPRILSCPTGMACRCYDSPYTLFKDSPAEIDLVVTGTTVEVTGGTIPTNPMLTGVPERSIPLSSSATPPQAGAVHPYTVTVNGNDVTVKLSMTTGYRPEKYIKYSSADCGYTGNTLECTFHRP